ncbi:DUF3301 domain-containing protein [Shewanella sp. A3A]|uniref:DUF3301 domain-containing protein n=1 Tax=Shewanella electrica TaxID=515560 RepID=A0ABT2FKM6_9GAMM|nr:DUF3301 domain-containing protein [Shewanella electrica]MCH1919848.1 DUF3301 domain-containing protein [Shewanella ferrihydritica]MCH1924679.1 DUF3301 domain-containing protein [Shewanella electrica]MCS4556873.1 DUF3301 domain-containing protein [Shewanella electrica]
MMTDFLMIAALVLIAAFFWQLRQMAEIAKRFIERECSRQRVQFLAVAMDNARPSFGGTTGIGWRASFMFEFSTDGINQFKGTVRMRGNQVQKIEWPIFPEPDWQQAPSARGKFGGGCGGSSCGSGGCH